MVKGLDIASGIRATSASRYARAKLISAHAVQKCLYEVLLYADGEDAVMYAEAAHVVATLMDAAAGKLDPVHLRLVTEEAEHDGTAEPTP